MREGYIAARTATRPCPPSAVIRLRRSVTSPTVIPRKWTGAPGCRPRTDSLKSRVISNRSASGFFMARAWFSNSLNSVAAVARATGALPAGVSNAMPPIRIEASDCVSTRMPLASTLTSMPLACQKRVFVLTYWSKGALMNAVTFTPSRSSSTPVTWPAGRRRKYTGEPTSSDPALAPRRTSGVPGLSPATTGGASSPTNSRRLFSDLPAPTPMYAPESSVSRPDTVPAAMRGRTTQKRVSSTRWGATSLARSAFTMTSFKSGETDTDRTIPICTSLYFSLVFPASTPSPFLNLMVMEGPRSRTVFTPSQPASSAATSGTSHTAGMRQRARPAGTAWGISALISAGCIALRVPDEPRIEAHCGEHGEDHDRGEGEGAGPRLDVRQRLCLDQGCQDRDDVDVEHRPAADELHDAISARAAARLPRRAQVHRSREAAERHDLQERHADAGDENHERERPGAGPQEVEDAAQNRVVL